MNTENSVLSEILKAVEPKSREVSIDIAGTVCTFRVETDACRLAKLRDESQAFAKRVIAEVPSEEVAAKAFVLAELSIEPKWTTEFAITLSASAGHVLNAVFDMLDAYSHVAIQYSEATALEESKKNSEPMSEGEIS